MFCNHSVNKLFNDHIDGNESFCSICDQTEHVYACLSLSWNLKGFSSNAVFYTFVRYIKITFGTQTKMQIE